VTDAPLLRVEGVRAVYGDRLRIALNPDRLHFFDAQTDATI